MSRWSSPFEILGVGTGSSNAVTAGRDYEGHLERRFESGVQVLVRCGMPSRSRSREVLQPERPKPDHPESEHPREEGLRHQLTAGQMAMVAVGGSIGTGLLLGSGVAMEVAGPAAILSFAAAAFINFTVAMALGELASAHPGTGSFGVY